MPVVEIERRQILFTPNTTLPDDSQLTWDADPNTVVNGNSAGETLLYGAAALKTSYIQSNGTHWRKTASPNTWTKAILDASDVPIGTDYTGGLLAGVPNQKEANDVLNDCRRGVVSIWDITDTSERAAVESRTSTYDFSADILTAGALAFSVGAKYVDLDTVGRFPIGSNIGFLRYYGVTLRGLGVAQSDEYIDNTTGIKLSEGITELLWIGSSGGTMFTHGEFPLAGAYPAIDSGARGGGILDIHFNAGLAGQPQASICIDIGSSHNGEFRFSTEGGTDVGCFNGASSDSRFHSVSCMQNASHAEFDSAHTPALITTQPVSNQFTLSSVAGLSVNDWVILGSNEADLYGTEANAWSDHRIARITAIDTLTITVYLPFFFNNLASPSYRTELLQYSATLGSSEVQKVVIGDCYRANDRSAPTGTSAWGGPHHCIFDNIWVSNPFENGMVLLAGDQNKYNVITGYQDTPCDPIDPNNSTTLSADIDNSQTSFDVASVANWPVLANTPLWDQSVHHFYILVTESTKSEVMRVTGVSGTTLTVSRGVSHSSHSGVAYSSSADSFTSALAVVVPFSGWNNDPESLPSQGYQLVMHGEGTSAESLALSKTSAGSYSCFGEEDGVIDIITTWWKNGIRKIGGSINTVKNMEIRHIDPQSHKSWPQSDDSAYTTPNASPQKTWPTQFVQNGIHHQFVGTKVCIGDDTPENTTYPWYGRSERPPFFGTRPYAPTSFYSSRRMESESMRIGHGQTDYHLVLEKATSANFPLYEWKVGIDDTTKDLKFRYQRRTLSGETITTDNVKSVVVDPVDLVQMPTDTFGIFDGQLVTGITATKNLNVVSDSFVNNDFFSFGASDVKFNAWQTGSARRCIVYMYQNATTLGCLWGAEPASGDPIGNSNSQFFRTGAGSRDTLFQTTDATGIVDFQIGGNHSAADTTYSKMRISATAITAYAGVSFTGSGSGLTGTAISLSIGGNAATATTATTATNATKVNCSVSSSSTCYLAFVAGEGYNTALISSLMTANLSTGELQATSFSFNGRSVTKTMADALVGGSTTNADAQHQHNGNLFLAKYSVWDTYTATVTGAGPTTLDIASGSNVWDTPIYDETAFTFDTSTGQLTFNISGIYEVGVIFPCYGGTITTKIDVDITLTNLSTGFPSIETINASGDSTTVTTILPIVAISATTTAIPKLNLYNTTSGDTIGNYNGDVVFYAKLLRRT